MAIGAISASRGAAAPSRNRCASCPSDEVVGGFFFDFGAIRTVSSEYDAPAQALQAPEVDVERTYIIRSAEEGREEAQGPEAVGDLGVSIVPTSSSKADGTSRRWHWGGEDITISCRVAPGRYLIFRRRVFASVLQAASHAFFGICRRNTGFSPLSARPRRQSSQPVFPLYEGPSNARYSSKPVARE